MWRSMTSKISRWRVVSCTSDMTATYWCSLGVSNTRSVERPFVLVLTTNARSWLNLERLFVHEGDRHGHCDGHRHAARDPADPAPAAPRRRTTTRHRLSPASGRGGRRAPRRDRHGRPRGRPGFDCARGQLCLCPRAAYVVQPGDTLWSVARSLQPEGDLRPLVRGLSQANGGAALAIGQVLALP